MPRRLAPLLWSWWGVAVVAGAIAALEILAIGAVRGDYSHPAIADYGRLSLPNPDDAGPAVWALATGHVGLATKTQPVIGGVSLVLRAPFALLGNALGGVPTEYRLGAFVCLWALALLAAALIASRQKADWRAGLLAAAVVMASRATIDAIRAGHPEELLAAAFACGGVWAATRRRAAPAGGLIGLGIGTLPWTAVALLPALLVGGPARPRLVLTAVLVAAVTVLPLPLSAPHTYTAHARALTRTERVYGTSAWWPVAHRRQLHFSSGGSRLERRQLYEMPLGLDRGRGLALAALLALVVTALVHLWRRGRPLGTYALALLSAVLLLRCIFDPLNLDYYAVPAFVALALWEVLGARRLPIVALAVAIVDRMTFDGLFGGGDAQAVVYLVWSTALVAYLVAVSVRAREHVL